MEQLINFSIDLIVGLVCFFIGRWSTHNKVSHPTETTKVSTNKQAKEAFEFNAKREKLSRDFADKVKIECSHKPKGG